MFILKVEAEDEFEQTHEYALELDFMPNEDIAEIIAMGILFEHDWTQETIAWRFSIERNPESDEQFH